MTGSLCNATNTTVFTDSGDYAKNTLIILNHLITNLLDEYNVQIMIILIFALYFYQCTKIHYYSQNQKKAIEFQILFCIWTLIKILQLSYAYIGIQVDQSRQWKTAEKNKSPIKQIYCDPQLLYLMEECYKCYVRFEVNGLIFSINYFFNLIVVQIITFFWQWQVSPLMFLGFQENVLMTQCVPRNIKILYIIIVIIDLLLLGHYILVWVLIYYLSHIQYQTLVDISVIVQIAATVLTMSYFLYNFYVKKSNRERFDMNQKLAVVFIGSFQLYKIALSSLYLNIENQYAIADFQRTTFSYKYFLYKLPSFDILKSFGLSVKNIFN